MNSPRLFVALLGVMVSAPAIADVTFAARVWDGDTWESFLGTDSDFITPISFGIFATFTEGDALFAATFNITGAESRPLDASKRELVFTGSGLGRQDPYIVEQDPIEAYFGPAGWRLDAANDDANNPDIGIVLIQPFDLPSHDNPVLMFRFDFIPAPGLTNLVLHVTPGDTGVMLALPGGGFSTPAPADFIETATVVFVPAPASVAILAFAVVPRRRRTL